jgi:hypothetical protein
MTEDVKKLRKKVAILRKTITSLENRLAEVQEDRRLLREHFTIRYNWWSRLLTERNEPSIPWLLHDDGLWLRRFKWWFISGEEK